MSCTKTKYNCSASFHPLHEEIPSSSQPESVFLAVLLSHRYKLFVCNNGGITKLDDVLTPQFSYGFHLPIDVFTLPAASRKQYLLDVLKSMRVNKSAGEDLLPKIESLVLESIELNGLKGFQVVARVDGVTAQVLDPYGSVQSKLGLDKQTVS